MQQHDENAGLHRAGPGAFLVRGLLGVATIGGLAALAVLAYAVCLGWQGLTWTGLGAHPEDYRLWQIVLLVLVIGGLAWGAGRTDRTVEAAFGLPIGLTIGFVMVAAADQDSDGLWPIGAALLATGSLIAVVIVAGVAAARRRQLRVGAGVS